jgi:hypothetical protein
VIWHKTVFVVGAGGSCAYAFPSGQQLLLDAKVMTIEGIQDLTRNYYPNERIESFQAALIGCQSDSIDTLLEYRDDCEHLGRLYIASKILRAEHQSSWVTNLPFGWLGYLFQRMDDGCGSISEFAGNPVTFVTYNYDRLIEARISGGLRSRYLTREKDAEDSIQQFWVRRPVIHLHGSLGPLRRVPFGAAQAGESIDTAIANLIERAAGGMKIVHQADGTTDEFSRARAALDEADRVVFLGFSFGRANVDRLNFSCIGSNAQAICSRYGMTDAEVAVQIVEPFKQAGRNLPVVAHVEDDCLGTLRRHVDKLVRRY